MSHLRPGTRQNIEGRLTNHILPTFGSRQLGSIRPSDVRAWVATLSDKGLSPGTVRSTYQTFGKIMRTAEVDGLVARTPCIGIELPRDAGHEEKVFLSAAEVARLAEAIDPRYRALMHTAAYTGMRWGELAGLKVERCNLLRDSIDVREALSEVSGHLHEGPTKTGKRRTLSIPRFLATMLGEHIGQYPSSDGHVFSSVQRHPLRRRNFYRRQYKPAVKAAGLDERLRFHDLRHTCAALLIEQGAHAKEIRNGSGTPRSA